MAYHGKSQHTIDETSALRLRWPLSGSAGQLVSRPELQTGVYDAGSIISVYKLDCWVTRGPNVDKGAM